MVATAVINRYAGALVDVILNPGSGITPQQAVEQLRALEAGMRISVSLIEAGRLGVQVDTPADLERARRLFSGAH